MTFLALPIVACVLFLFIVVLGAWLLLAYDKQLRYELVEWLKQIPRRLWEFVSREFVFNGDLWQFHFTLLLKLTRLGFGLGLNWDVPYKATGIFGIPFMFFLIEWRKPFA